MTPKWSIESECERRGRDNVIHDCIAILNGRAWKTTSTSNRGPSAENVLEGRDGGIDVYWPRVWAARVSCTCGTTSPRMRLSRDDARRMARTRDVGQGDRATSRRFGDRRRVILLDDENARVRASAARAFRTIAES